MPVPSINPTLAAEFLAMSPKLQRAKAIRDEAVARVTAERGSRPVPAPYRGFEGAYPAVDPVDFHDRMNRIGDALAWDRRVRDVCREIEDAAGERELAA